MEQIRGNAALKSISQSPNAERILKGKKGKEALERSSAMLRKESTSKTVMGIAEAYSSIYEKKCVDKKDKGMHNCAKKVCHEEYGEGETIFGQHAVPDENGFVSHYDVQFEHGIVENVSVEDMEVLTMEGHMKEGHRYEGEMISEEEVDVFDVIKGYLIDEGYADSEESALAIMANMTEDQRTEILEAVGIVGPPKKAIDAIPGVRNARIGAANAVKRLDYGLNDEIKQVGKHVVPSPRMGGKFDRPGGTKYKDISGDK